jgi:hypothetical protein
VETDDVWQKQASVRKRSTIGMLPRVTAETPENGLTMGENVETGDFRQKGQASENLSTTRSVPRITAKPIKRLNDGRKHGNGQLWAKTDQRQKNCPQHVR